MVKSNYHIHSTYCDGNNTLEEMTLSAIEHGLTSIGFSSHFYFEFDDSYTIKKEQIPEYLNEIERLKEKYKDQIDIYKSFEIDYRMDTEDINDLAKEIIPELDYVIGSIHTIGLTLDGKKGVIDYLPEMFYDGIYKIYGSPEVFIEEYFNAIADMAEKMKPDIIGHIDLIKKNNQGYFSEEDDYYKKAVRKALDRIAKTDCIIEVNTGGVYRYGEECFYPSDFILEEIKKRNIPITLNGDTHFKDGIDFYYKEAEEKLKRLGFDTIKVFNGSDWQDYQI